MLSNLSLLRFRGFRELSIRRLSRVNLFVGTNNAGKTSILEAVEILVRATPDALWRSPLRRRERSYSLATREDEEFPSDSNEIELSHLFFGHSLKRGSSFVVQGDAGSGLRVHCEIGETPPDWEDRIAARLPPRDLRALAAAGRRPFDTLRFESHLTSQATPLALLSGRDARFNPAVNGAQPVHFIGTDAPESRHLSTLWDRVVLTPEEPQVIAALQIIEPSIERVAFLAEGRPASPTVFLKLEGSEQRLPLGSVGDGLKRLLTLALHLVSAQKGFLLVDEIDTGLHYTVMADMWRLVIETARRLDVQVFATTHSLDCVRALAWVQQQHPDLAQDVTLHRVERENPETVNYSAEELAAAAEHHVEVR